MKKFFLSALIAATVTLGGCRTVGGKKGQAACKTSFESNLSGGKRNSGEWGQNHQNSQNDKVYFGYDSYSVEAEEQEKVSRIANHMSSNGHSGKSYKVEGHCDARGTSDYNFALGEKRANSVAHGLRRLGVSKDCLMISSKGSSEALGGCVDEAAMARDRNVAISER